MRISTKVTYACLALIDIAQSEADGFPRRLREIAHCAGDTAKIPAQILLHLKAAGLVRVLAGPGRLSTRLEPANISLSHVIGAIDGQDSLRSSAAFRLLHGICQKPWARSSQPITDCLERSRSRSSPDRPIRRTGLFERCRSLSTIATNVSTGIRSSLERRIGSSPQVPNADTIEMRCTLIYTNSIEIMILS